MKGTNLGELEEILLLTIAAMGENTYGYAIKENIEERTGRENMNLSAVHACLYRLEKKGFLTSEFGGATKKRGGKRKKYFRLSGDGKDAILEARRIRTSLWDEISMGVNWSS